MSRGFAAKFQRYVRGGALKPPADVAAHLREYGIHNCREEVPCWFEGPGTLCPCMRRQRLLRAFFRVTALGFKGEEFPTEVVQHGLVPEVCTVFHRPVFTFVCPWCRSRDVSYSMGSYMGRALDPTPPDTWIGVITPRLNHRVHACCRACADALCGLSSDW
jgi:hypothetical protein